MPHVRFAKLIGEGDTKGARVNFSEAIIKNRGATTDLTDATASTQSFAFREKVKKIINKVKRQR